MGITLKTENLSRHFGGVRALNGVTVSVEERTVRGIIGPNGAGKTTLFNLITGRIPATSGQVIFQGEDITKLSVHDRVRLGVSRTFQINSLFSGSSAFENVRIARQIRMGGSYKIFSRRESLKEVNTSAFEVLSEVGLEDKATAVANTLSYGDQRSLEIAVALASEPKILLLDEPTAGMSGGETNRIILLIEKLARKIAIVLVEHDVDMVLRVSDSISVMHQGSIIAEGSPDEICASKLVSEVYLGEGDRNEDFGA